MLEFGEFCQLAARFLIEEDEEALKKELKEAFRIYDKEGESESLDRAFLKPQLHVFYSLGNGYITTTTLKEILGELDNKLSEEDLDGIIEEVDEDGSGTLDFDGNPRQIHPFYPNSNFHFFRVHGYDGWISKMNCDS